MAGWYYRDALPLTAMVTMECTNVGLNTLFKAATLSGMSYHVFVVYAYGLAAIVLLPAPFLSQRSRVLPPLNFSIMSKIVLLGVIGSSSQIMGYTGINFSSPTLASAISNLVPAFTFILAIIFRMEKIVLRSTSTSAKILGTLLSISGAFVVTLYKGRAIYIAHSSSVSLQQPLNSLNSRWVIGGLLLTAEYILVPLWYIVQAQIMKEYPNELTVIFFYNLIVSIIAAVVGLITEKDPNAWRLGPNIALASVVCSGLFGSFMNNTVHAWALHLKGPVYVAMFKPLSIAIAVAMGVMFLGDTLHLGRRRAQDVSPPYPFYDAWMPLVMLKVADLASFLTPFTCLVGATIISIGFYTVMWGKRKETGEDYGVESLESTSTNRKVPLLQSYKTAKDIEQM